MVCDRNLGGHWSLRMSYSSNCEVDVVSRPKLCSRCFAVQLVGFERSHRDLELG